MATTMQAARSRRLQDSGQNPQLQQGQLPSLNSQSQENLLGQPSQPTQSSPQQSPSQSPQQQPQVAATSSRTRNTSHLPLSNLIYRPASPSQNLHGALNPASPAQSVGSTGGGVIYRDERDDPVPDIITLLPNTHRNTPPQTQSPSQQSPSQQHSPQQQQQQQQQQQTQQTRRLQTANMADQELDSVPTQGNTHSPTGSFRRKARNGSAGSADFVIPEVSGLLGKESPTTGRRSEDRPGSSGRREQREKDKERAEKADTPRRSTENARRPIPQSFDSSATIKPMSNPAINHSSSDLLTSSAVSQSRDSPSHDQGGNARKHSVDSVDSIMPPNGEPGGWVSYESETSPQGPPPRNSSESWRDNDRGRQTNQNYNNSRFSPDRIPFTEDADRDEDAVAQIPDHGIIRNGSSGSLNKVSPPPVQPQQTTRKRDLPGIPAQQGSQSQQQAQQTHGHGFYSHTNQSIIPVVPKTQHAQIIQSQNWIRRPSSPLAREPVVAAQTSSEEETESHTPRSPPQALPDISNLHYPPSRDYRQQPQTVQRNRPQQQPQPQQQQQPPQQQLPPQPLYESMNRPILPMYTGASMATALSSISPSQSVSAVGSPRGRAPALGSYGSGRSGRNGGMYPTLGGMGMGISKIPGMTTNASLDQQIAALNATNLSALAQLTPEELRALGFGLGRLPTSGSGQSQQSQPISKPEPVNPGRGGGITAGGGGGGANRLPSTQDLHHPRGSADIVRLIDTLDEAAGEVVELQDLQREMEMNLEWPNQRSQRQQQPQQPQQARDQQWTAHEREMQKQFHEQQQQLLQQQLNAVLGLSPGGASHTSQQTSSQLPPVYHGGFSATPPGHTRTGSGGDRRNMAPVGYDEPPTPSMGAAQNITGSSQQQAASNISSSHIHHSRPGAPIPPTPMSGNTAAGTRAIRGTPYPLTLRGLPAGSTANGSVHENALRSGEGWIPIPNTDGYPPSYAELIDLFARHNHGRQPTIRDVLAMQMAALASEAENVEGSVFSKSETPFPPVGFNPFLPASKGGYTDSARSSPRDPPGDFGPMLRRVPGFSYAELNPRAMRPPSTVFGYGDGETEVSRLAQSTTTEGDHDDGITEDELTDKEPGAHSLVSGLRLSVQQKPPQKDGEVSMSNTALEDAMKMAANGSGVGTGVNPNDITALYPLLSNLTGHAGTYGMRVPPSRPNDDWVDEQDSDEELEAELEMWDEEGVKRHPRFVRDEAKRRRKWEIKFAELVKAFHELDRLTDTPMILLASPPRPDSQNTLINLGQLPPVKPHLAISRSIRRDPGYTNLADAARRSYHTILTTPPTPRPPMSYQSISPTSNSPPSQRLSGWSGPPSISSVAGMDEPARAQMQAALSSLRLLTKVEERREMRRLEEVMKVREERSLVETMLRNILSNVQNGSANGSQPRGPGSAGVGGDESARESGSTRAASSEPGGPIAGEDTTQSASTQKATD